MNREKKKKSRSLKKEKIKRETLDRKKMKKDVLQSEKRLREYIKERIRKMDKKEILKYENKGEVSDQILKELEEEAKKQNIEIPSKRINKKVIYSVINRVDDDSDIAPKLNILTKRSRRDEQENKKIINSIKSEFGKKEREAQQILEKSRKEGKSISQILKEKNKEVKEKDNK